MGSSRNGQTHSDHHTAPSQPIEVSAGPELTPIDGGSAYRQQALANMQFREMADLSPAILWTAAADGTITWANNRWFEYTGLHRDPDPSKWYGVVHCDDLNLCKSLWAKALRECTEFELEVRKRRQDGEYRWFLTRATAVRNQHGQVIKWCGSSLDIHDQKQVAQARALLATIVDSTDDAVISMSLDGRITSWNAAARRLFGFSAAKAIGQHITLIIPPDRLGEEKEILERIRRSQRIDHYETERLTKDGRRIAISLTISPIRDDDGKVIGASKVARDITRRLRDEAELRRRAREQTALYQFTDRLYRTSSETDSYDAALDAMVMALDCERVAILMCDQGGVARFVAWRGLSEAYRRAVEGHMPWPLDDPDPKPITLSDLSDTRLEDSIRGAVESEQIASLAFVPLVSDNRIVGKFMIYYPTRHEFEVEEMDLALAISRQLAFSIERLRADEQRRISETALRESEERFVRFMKHLPGLAWIKDARGRYVYANPAALEAFGTAPKDLYQKTDEEVFPLETAKAFVEHDQQALECDAGVQVVESLKHPDLQIYHSLVNKFRIPGGDPSRDLIGGMAIDITAIKHAEEALRDSEERFRELANGIDQFAWSCDVLGKVTWYNQRWFEYTGSTMEEAQGEGWVKYHHPDHLARVREGLRAALESGELWEDVFPLRGCNGTFRWFLSRAVPIRDANGQVLRWLGTNTDVTDQRETEHALRESERRMSTLLSNLPGMAYRYQYDDARTVEYVSEGAKELTGFEPGHFVDGSRQWSQIIHSADAGWVSAAIRTSVHLHEPFELEYRILHADGDERWVWEQGEAVFDENGRPIALEGFVTDITERRRAEEQLRESESRFRYMANAAPVFIWLAGTDKRRTWVNQPWLNFVGRTPEEELEDGWLESIHPEDVERCQRAYRDNGKPFSIEYRLRRSDGVYRWVYDHGIPLVDESGALRGYIGSGIDISERKEAEAALRAKEAELHLVASATPVILARCSRDLRYLFVNRALARLFGMAPEEMIGRSIPDMIGKDAFKKVKPHLDRVLQGESVEYDDEFEFKAVGRRWVRVNYTPERDELGDVVGWVASVVDITDRRHAEHALRVSEARYKAAIDTAMDCIINMDSQGCIIAFNPAAERTFGYRPDEVIGRPVTEVLVPPEMQKSREQGLRRWLEDGEATLFGRRIEMPAMRKDGTRLIVELSMARTPDQPPSVTAFMRDVTEQRRAVEELKRSHELLERRVAERTTELQHRANQLARLTSELTLAERRERQRLARILHDHLQQLLASGKLGLEFIARSNDEERRNEWIEHARSCVEDAIEASRSLSVELSPPVLHEGGLAAGCQWLARWMKDRHDLEVQLKVDAAANPQREDVRTLVFESIRELLFNVAKHAKVKKATLELSADEGDRLRVVIEDQGVGFNPAQVADSTDHPAFGLFNVRERLVLLGGSFEIESSMGQGSRFILIAPRHSVTNDSAQEPELETFDDLPEQTMMTVRKAKPQRTDRIRVLVVDDHAVMRQGLCSLLAEEPGLEVVGEASDGVEAIQQTRNLEPDIVLMDYSLPGMTGAEATHVIRRDLPGVQVIALSMHRERERAEAMLAAGAVAYLNKSDDSDALIEAISKYASRTTNRSQ